MSYQSARSISLTPIAGAVAAHVFVEMTAAGFQAVGTEGADSVGVSLEASAATEQYATPVMCLDGAVGEVLAGAAIAAGAAIMSNNAGKAITHTGTSAILGYARDAVAAADETLTFVASKGKG